ncbi:hypothetical protein [Radicibacter daui]|uniref:hypothetical protein n=1 Tax=Radicibacter daui TaxID=3064829 RepID=UPI00404701D5
MAGTMKKSNVIIPPGSGKQLPLSLFISGSKGDFERNITGMSDADAKKISWSEALKIATKVKGLDKEYENAYWKIGLVGKELVFRIKADKINGGIMSKLFGSKEYFDVTLLNGVALREATKSGGSDKIGGSSYFVLTASECPKIFNDYIDIGKGYALDPTIVIEGAGKNPALRAEIEKERKALLDKYQKECKKIADDTGKTLAALKITSGKSLEDICKEADAEFKKLLDPAKIGKEFEASVTSMVAKNANFKQQHTEWKIKGACSAIITTLKLAANALKLVASHGADVSSYVSIVSNCKSLYDTISDFLKTEAEVIKALEKAITLYQTQTDSMVNDIKAIYDSYDLDKATAWQKIKAGPKIASDTIQQIKDKIDKALKKSPVASLKGAPPPETARVRYSAEVGSTIKKLETTYKALEKEIDKFKNSDITKAVQLWTPLQNMKSAATDALTALQERKAYADAAKARIEALGISTSDLTTLDKLQAFAKGVKTFDKDQVVTGIGGVATVAGTVNKAYKAVDGLASAVKAFV